MSCIGPKYLTASHVQKMINKQSLLILPLLLTSDDVIALVYSVCFYVVYSVTITSMFTLYLDKRTTDSVAIYLLPQIYCPVEIGGTTDPFLAH